MSVSGVGRCRRIDEKQCPEYIRSLLDMPMSSLSVGDFHIIAAAAIHSAPSLTNHSAERPMRRSDRRIYSAKTVVLTAPQTLTSTAGVMGRRYGELRPNRRLR